MARNDPTMNRRHFELIAGVINALDLSTLCGGSPLGTSQARLIIAHDFARCLESANQSFSREAFINACTVADRKRAEKLTKRNLAKGKSSEPVYDDQGHTGNLGCDSAGWPDVVGERDR